VELARAYAASDLSWQTAYALRQAGRLAPDAGRRSRLVAPAGAGDAILGRARLDNAAALARRFAAWLMDCPGDWLTWLYLARLREMPGTEGSPTAEDAATHARALEFLPGETLHWLGVWRLNAGDAQGAIAALAQLPAQRYGSMMYLGEALLRTGQTEAAEKAFERASESNNPVFLHMLASRVYGHNYWQEAIAVLHKAHALRPADVPILLTLARIQSEVYDLAACKETLARVRTLSPDHPELRLLEASQRGRMGDALGHLAMLRQAYANGGDPRSRLASSLAMTALYDDTLSPEAVAALHRQLCAPIEDRLPPPPAFRVRNNLRLRVGFVTGDLHRQHPVAIFMLPLLARLDQTRMEVCIYYTGTIHDDHTRQAEACADRWVEAAGLDDDALRTLIMADGVDVLVDLAGHTSSHRLGLFAMRAAPVQATFLGYPHSTGLRAIDWLVGDPVVSPAEHAGLFTEGLARMPHSVFCFSPIAEYPLPSPRPVGAPVTFGSFNNAMKLSAATIRLWARVLAAVPDATLLLKAPSLRDASVCDRFAAAFAAHGIAAERVAFRGPTGLADMMAEYGDIDIGLDPLPYNGGTTTMQALWMGVPVVTLAGGNFVGRMGASFMRSLGRPDWVAADETGYVASAARLAADVGSLRTGRAALRARMAASALCDIDGYARDFQALLHRMWDQYEFGAQGGHTNGRNIQLDRLPPSDVSRR